MGITKLLALNLLVSGIAFTSAHAADAAAPDVNKIRSLTEEENYLEALKLATPCINAKSATAVPNLESCLYEAEQAAQLARDLLDDKVSEDENIQAKTFEAWPEVAAVKAAGVQIKFENTPDIGPSTRYDHGVCRKLITLFPNSAHVGECEYNFISNDYDWNSQDYKKWESALEGFLKKYPDDKYSNLARLDLAHIYGDLWDLTRPDSPDPENRKKFASGNADKDKNTAEQYRERAMQVLTEILSSKGPNALDEDEVEEIKMEIDLLSKRESDETYYIINE